MDDIEPAAYDEYVDDDLGSDNDYIEDPEQQTQEDLELSEFHDDLDTDILADITEQEKDLKTALTSSAPSVYTRGRVGPDVTISGGPANPYNFPVFHTRNYLTKYEKTTFLGMRAEQLRRGAMPYVSLEVKDANGKVIRVLNDEDEIAKAELGQGILPLTADRPLPSNTTNRPTYVTMTLKNLINSTNPNF